MKSIIFVAMLVIGFASCDTTSTATGSDTQTDSSMNRMSTDPSSSSTNSSTTTDTSMNKTDTSTTKRDTLPK